MLVSFFAVFYGTIQMYGVVPKGLIPDTDNDTMNVFLRAAQGTSFYEMVNHVERVSQIVNENPNVSAV